MEIKEVRNINSIIKVLKDKTQRGQFKYKGRRVNIFFPDEPNAIRVKRVMENRYSNGLCKYCGKRPFVKDKVTCQVCIDKNKARYNKPKKGNISQSVKKVKVKAKKLKKSKKK